MTRIVRPANPCRVFYLCTNQATTTVSNPVLGAVPACARCAARVEANR